LPAEVKAVIPAAGLGTRFLPIAKAVPKELMPLGAKPVIGRVVEEAAAAGFDEILIVLSRGKEAIADYFKPNPGLEAHLERVGKDAELRAVREVAAGAAITFAYQPEMRGLGDAVLCAREFVGSDVCFAVLLGDTVMHGGSPLPAMVRAWIEYRLSCVALEPCPAERVSRYGIAGGREERPGVFRLGELSEKPSENRAPRLFSADGAPLPYHAFAARYLLATPIFDILDATPPGRNGEVQLTDAMETLRAAEGLLGVAWEGLRLDIGNPAGLHEAAASFLTK
jgi:UTP--glucose-1-phosphate uridylyltransferase